VKRPVRQGEGAWGAREGCGEKAAASGLLLKEDRSPAWMIYSGAAHGLEQMSPP